MKSHFSLHTALRFEIAGKGKAKFNFVYLLYPLHKRQIMLETVFTQFTEARKNVLLTIKARLVSTGKLGLVSGLLPLVSAIYRTKDLLSWLVGLY